MREVHRIFAGYYRHPRDVDEVIGLVGLAEKRDAQVKTLSGGQKRRLDLGVALVGDPELVFLDEPTTGFDPAARRNAWALVRSLRELGKTILLTTHYLDEAQQLADRVAVLRDGEIVRIGKPSELTASAGVQIRYRRLGEEVVLETDEPTRALHELTATRAGRGIRARGPRAPPRDARGRLPRSGRRGERVSALLAPAAGRAADDLAQPRGRDLRLPLPAAALRPARLGLRRRDRGRPRGSSSYLVAGLIGYAVANTALGGLAITLVIRRESGMLKRLRSTPLPGSVYLVGVLASNLLIVVLQSLTVIATRRAPLRLRPAEACALVHRSCSQSGRVCFAGLGLAAAALIRSAEAVRRRRQRDHPADVVSLRRIRHDRQPARPCSEVVADVLPLKYLIELVLATYVDGEPIWDHLGAVGVMAAWGAGGYLVARARFGWEPRER